MYLFKTEQESESSEGDGEEEAGSCLSGEPKLGARQDRGTMTPAEGTGFTD